jgi:formylmethanofuran dehydrogenase subunit D
LSLTQIGSGQLAWRKAKRSMNNGDCVEVAPADGKILVRDSKNPGGPALEYPVGVWRNFVVKARQDGLG